MEGTPAKFGKPADASGETIRAAQPMSHGHVMGHVKFSLVVATALRVSATVSRGRYVCERCEQYNFIILFNATSYPH